MKRTTQAYCLIAILAAITIVGVALTACSGDDSEPVKVYTEPPGYSDEAELSEEAVLRNREIAETIVETISREFMFIDDSKSVEDTTEWLNRAFGYCEIYIEEGSYEGEMAREDGCFNSVWEAIHRFKKEQRSLGRERQAK